MVLTSRQYRTQLQGDRQLYDNNGYQNGTQSADPIVITDFTTGESGDVLDFSDLLKNAAVNYSGENPFATGHIKLVQSGNDTLFQFDADASGDASQLLTVAVLKSSSASQLLSNNFSPTSRPMVLLHLGKPPLAPVVMSWMAALATTRFMGLAVMT